MWSSGPAPHGQTSGNACREQVMTRQPAEENRIAVAWPMPRLAPVKSSVRRGALDEEGMQVFQLSTWSGRLASGIEPHLRPRAVRRIATEFDAVVETERAVVPEFETGGVNAPAAPSLRARHFADHVFGGDQRDRLLEGKAA